MNKVLRWLLSILPVSFPQKRAASFRAKDAALWLWPVKCLFGLFCFHRNHYDAGILPIVGAGNESEQAVIFIRRIPAALQQLIRKGQKVLIAGKFHPGERGLIDVGFDCGNDFKVPGALRSFQRERRVLLQKARIHHFFQHAEHRPVIHVVAINHQIAALGCAVRLKEQASCHAPLLTIIAAQVVFRVLRTALQHRIIHHSARNGEPGFDVGILLLQARKIDGRPAFRLRPAVFPLPVPSCTAVLP